MHRCLFMLFLFVLFVNIIVVNAFGQYRKTIPFQLISILNDPSRSETPVHLFVKGDEVEIQNALSKADGHLKYNVRDYYAVIIPAGQVNGFINQPFVENIAFFAGTGTPLNDSVIVHNNVSPVHQGALPLLQPYLGDNVVLGIIDTGIELLHPDFQDVAGKTRVLRIWDQNMSFDPVRTPAKYNYGQVWYKSDIDAGICPHKDNETFSAHGSHVAGVAVGDGSSVNNFKGMAPKSDIIMVAANFNAVNWTSTVADGVDYIFRIADSLEKPCVINISAGTYWGSHDGKDMPALFIDSIATSQPGRAVVCASGNAGNSTTPFHLKYNVTADTAFTWFVYEQNIIYLPYTPNGGVYFELFADTADFNNVRFAIGADKNSPGYELRGMSTFFDIKNLFNGVYTLDGNGVYSDTLKNTSGQRLARIYIAADKINNNTAYALYVLLRPDSITSYNWRFSTTGNGKLDIWSIASLMPGTSNMISSGLPSSVVFPDIINYKIPDLNQSIVSSFTCAPNVITVGNYSNRSSYIDFNGNAQTIAVPTGAIWPSSSIGPTRDGRIKPDITSPGAMVLSCGSLPTLSSKKVNAPNQVAQGGWHWSRGGTSFSAPSVAGAVALYFQKCPRATFNDFYAAFKNTAQSDSSTGATPNNTWGFGKMDAKQALLTSNFTLALSPGGNISVCKELTINAPNGFESYQWVTGDTSKSILANQAANYYVVATNDKGCKGVSDTVHLSINPYILPKPPVTVTGDTIFCNGDSVKLSAPADFATYKWSNGPTTQFIYAKQTGFYKVTVLDSMGCAGVSDSIMVASLVKPPVPSIVQDGDTLRSSSANSYQWYKNGVAIPNDTGQNYIITQTGNYYVKVFHANGCSSQSNSIYVVKTGVEELFESEAVSVFPNPSNGKFFVSLGKDKWDISVLNMLGQVVLQKNTNSNYATSPIEIDLVAQPEGVYFLRALCNRAAFTIRLVKH